MRYLGGKFRLAQKIVAYLESVRGDNQPFLEPFVGAVNIITLMSGQRTGLDIHPDLIMLLTAVRDGTIELPDTMTESEYQTLKTSPPSALRGFAGFGCSFAGKWFGGFGRDDSGRKYHLNAKNTLLAKRWGLRNTELLCSDYRTVDPEGLLIVIRHTGTLLDTQTRSVTILFGTLCVSGLNATR